MNGEHKKRLDLIIDSENAEKLEEKGLTDEDTFGELVSYLLATMSGELGDRIREGMGITKEEAEKKVNEMLFGDPE